MMFDFENMDVILGNDNINPIERELSNVIGNSESHCNTESNPQLGDKNPHGNEFGNYVLENIVPGTDRFQETMETFTSEFNMRFSQEMDSMMSMMHTQINRAITSAIAERVSPDIQNVVVLCPLQEIWTRSLVCSQTVRKLEKTQMGLNQKLQKKDCRSAVDLRDNRDRSP